VRQPTLLELAEQALERINRERQAHHARSRALDEQRQRAADEVERWHAMRDFPAGVWRELEAAAGRMKPAAATAAQPPQTPVLH
jgi:hypothetical protein